MAHAYYADRIAPGSARSKTPEGFLIITGVPIARTGYQQYLASELGEPGNATLEVFRSAEEVFDAATMASFEGKSVTTPHPPRFLDTHTDASYSKGHVQRVRKGGKLADGETALLADLIIKDAQLINRLENGSIAEVSAGYECAYEQLTPTSFAQRNIRGNHVAIVPAGRCGPACRVNDCNGTCSHSAKEVTPMDGTQLEQLDASLTFVQKIAKTLGWKPPAQATTDAEPGPVELNLQAAEIAKANQRRIALDKEKEEEEQRMKDEAAEKEKEKKEAEDRAKAQDAKIAELKATVDALKVALDKKTKDGDEEEIESEDELIPIHALSGNELPKNPIPGADKAIDALKVLKPFVAKSGKAELRDALNLAYKVLRTAQKQAEDAGDEPDAYAQLSNAAERTHDGATVIETGDEKVAKAQSNFMVMTGKHHRRNPQEINAAAQGGK